MTPIPRKSITTSRHLTPLTLARLLEGGLEPWEQKAARAHLAQCPACAHALAETRRLLVTNHALPPATFHHPIERVLAPLRRLIPWPAWAWHALIHSAVPLLWLLLIDPRDLPQLESPIWTLLLWPASLLLTTHFLWQQSWFRNFGHQLWNAGAGREEVESLFRSRLAPLQGWSLGGNKLFFAIAMVVSILNAVLIPPRWWAAGVLFPTIGFYSLMVTASMYWSWGWSGRWWWGVIRLLRRYPDIAPEFLPKARQHAQIWLLIASVSMLWQLYTNLQALGMHPTIRLYGSILSLLLLSLWIGYALLERELMRGAARPFLNIRPALRLGGALLMALAPLALTWPVSH